MIDQDKPCTYDEGLFLSVMVVLVVGACLIWVLWTAPFKDSLERKAELDAKWVDTENEPTPYDERMEYIDFDCKVRDGGLYCEAI